MQSVNVEKSSEKYLEIPMEFPYVLYLYRQNNHVNLLFSKTILLMLLLSNNYFTFSRNVKWSFCIQSRLKLVADHWRFRLSRIFIASDL